MHGYRWIGRWRIGQWRIGERNHSATSNPRPKCRKGKEEMRIGGRLITAAAVLVLGAALSAQSGRDAYRDAFKAWRQVDPGLERDAATNPNLSARTGAAAAAAARYTAARSAYLRAKAAEANQSLEWLNNARL